MAVTTPFTCPTCGKALDWHEPVEVDNDAHTVNPGDTIVCTGCGGVLLCTGPRAVRVLHEVEIQTMTPDEQHQIAAARHYVAGYRLGRDLRTARDRRRAN